MSQILRNKLYQTQHIWKRPFFKHVRTFYDANRIEKFNTLDKKQHLFCHSWYVILQLMHNVLILLVFDSISSNVDEALSTNPSANVFVIGDLNVHHKDWLTYSGGTDRPGKLFYIFSISNNLIQIVKFPTWIPDSECHSSAISFFWC